jgi:hypothetical protein
MPISETGSFMMSISWISSMLAYFVIIPILILSHRIVLVVWWSSFSSIRIAIMITADIVCIYIYIYIEDSFASVCLSVLLSSKVVGSYMSTKKKLCEPSYLTERPKVTFILSPSLHLSLNGNLLISYAWKT